MSQLKLLLVVALRNLRARRINLVIGIIIFIGTVMVVVGGALLDSMDDAMKRSIVGSVAGHLQVYSADSQDELSLFGDLGQEPELSPLEDFSRLKTTLTSHPNVKTVVPMGINAAFIGTGNTVDETLARLRELYRQRDARGDTPERVLERDSLKAYARQLVELLEKDRQRNKVFSGEDATDTSEREALEQALSEDFWTRIEQTPFDSLEFLENRIAPQMAEGDLLYMRYVGTDLAAFQRNFDRMRIVDGTPVPAGQRGLLLSKLFYEEALKLKAARRMDILHDARTRLQLSIDNDPRLQRLLHNNRTQLREILFQLDPREEVLLRERLQRVLGSQGQDVEQLLVEFFTMKDADFEKRHAFFYAELVPLVELYRLKPGDSLAITGFTRSGYMQSINVRIYGTYQFEGLERSTVAGSFSLMDIMTFRDLYGFVTADIRDEIKDLQQASGVEEVPRESAEELLFGGAGSPLESTAVARKIDEDARLEGQVQKQQWEALAQRVYTQQEIDSGVAINAAVLLEDPDQLERTQEELQALVKQQGLSLRVISWQKASGLVGQFVLMAKLVLYVAVFIIFVVALVIINNAMMMATLRRAREVGTMRAIGAQRSFILTLVLMETLVLGLVFGASGSVAGSVIVNALGNTGLPANNEALSFFFSGARLFPTLRASNVAIALPIVVLVSALSTLYPAFLATRISPLKAMQTED